MKVDLEVGRDLFLSYLGEVLLNVGYTKKSSCVLTWSSCSINGDTFEDGENS